MSCPLQPSPICLSPLWTPRANCDTISTDERMGALLDLYDLPFVPSMFLAEKKVLWLRFVGAGRALMHRVLD